MWRESEPRHYYPMLWQRSKVCSKGGLHPYLNLWAKSTYFILQTCLTFFFLIYQWRLPLLFVFKKKSNVAFWFCPPMFSFHPKSVGTASSSPNDDKCDRKWMDWKSPVDYRFHCVLAISLMRTNQQKWCVYISDSSQCPLIPFGSDWRWCLLNRELDL